MEAIKTQSEQQPEQGIEENKTEAVSNEPVVGVKYFEEKGIIKSLENYRNATEEEKVLHCATQIVLQVLSKNKKPISSEEQNTILERTIRQVRAERANLFETLNEAEEELKRLNWNNIIPQSLTQSTFRRVGGNRIAKTQNSVKGMRGLFIITFGNFALAQNDQWIYRPTLQQMLNLVRRWPKKKPCEAVATDMRLQYKMTKNDIDKSLTESAAMTVFKKNLLNQINELRATV